MKHHVPDLAEADHAYGIFDTHRSPTSRRGFGWTEEDESRSAYVDQVLERLQMKRKEKEKRRQ